MGSGQQPVRAVLAEAGQERQADPETGERHGWQITLLSATAELVADAWRMRAPEALAADLDRAGDLPGSGPG